MGAAASITNDVELHVNNVTKKQELDVGPVGGDGASPKNRK